MRQVFPERIHGVEMILGHRERSRRRRDPAEHLGHLDDVVPVPVRGEEVAPFRHDRADAGHPVGPPRELPEFPVRGADHQRVDFHRGHREIAGGQGAQDVLPPSRADDQRRPPPPQAVRRGSDVAPERLQGRGVFPRPEERRVARVVDHHPDLLRDGPRVRRAHPPRLGRFLPGNGVNRDAGIGVPSCPEDVGLVPAAHEPDFGEPVARCGQTGEQEQGRKREEAPRPSPGDDPPNGSLPGERGRGKGEQGRQEKERRGAGPP